MQKTRCFWHFGRVRLTRSRTDWTQEDYLESENIGEQLAVGVAGVGNVCLSPFMLSEADPDTEAGELVARDCGADDTRSSTMTSMSLLLSSASASGGKEPGWSSLLREI